MKKIQCLCNIVLMLLLTSCSYVSSQNIIQNRDNHYLSAKTIPPLRIPPGIASNKFHNYYPASDRSYSEGDKKISLLPPGLMDNQQPRNS